MSDPHAPHQEHGSDHGEHGHHGHEAVRQEDDKPDTGRVFLVGIVGVVVTIASIFISYGYQKANEASFAPFAPDPKTLPGSYQAVGAAGIIERNMFWERKGDIPNGEAQQLLRNKQALLSTYGWVDRPRSLIRVPIGQAMDQVVNAYGQKK